MMAARGAESVWLSIEGTQGGCRGSGRGSGGTNFSYGVWVFHRHPKSIGCALPAQALLRVKEK